MHHCHHHHHNCYQRHHYDCNHNISDSLSIQWRLSTSKDWISSLKKRFPSSDHSDLIHSEEKKEKPQHLSFSIKGVKKWKISVWSTFTLESETKNGLYLLQKVKKPWHLHSCSSASDDPKHVLQWWVQTLQTFDANPGSKRIEENSNTSK